ncbi:hypothetical protein MKX01_029775 [Papaver californicum]|nr:hypothetical protein MKX01_029775 [Papaver californicum]
MERAWYESKLKNLTLIKNGFEDKPEGYKTAFSRLREQIIGLADERKAIYEREKETEERIAYLKDVIEKMESDKREMKMKDLRLEQDSTMRCEQKGLQNNNNVSYTDNGKEATNRQLDSEMDGGTNNALALYLLEEQVEPLISKVESGNGERKKIDIKSEERTVPPFEQGCSDNEKDLVPSFKRPFSSQKGREYDIKCTADDTPLSSAPKRRMLSKIIASDSESEEDDTTLNGKHKVKSFEELAASPKPQTYPVDPCAGDVTFSSGVHNVEEFITNSRQSFFTLRKCIEKESQVNGTSQEKISKLTAAKDEKEVVEKTSSNNKDSSRDSEDAVDKGIDFGTVVAMMRRNRNEKLKNLGQQ